MGPSIIPSSRLGFRICFTNPERKLVSGFALRILRENSFTVLNYTDSALKQRSPAGGRRAVRKIHQIEKMNHCEVLSLGCVSGMVKAAHDCRIGKSAPAGEQEVVPILSPRFCQQI